MRCTVKPIFLSVLFVISAAAQAQSIKNLPSLPRGGTGIHGSVGAGFADFKTISPSADYRQDRGTYVATSIERGFNVLHLYLTMGLSYMDATGLANYDYANLTSSTTYSMDDVEYRAKSYEVGLGLKLKLIDDYWFRPYIEGGGLGSYNELSWGSQLTQLSGNGYKRKDVIMGSGYYVEAGVEIEFSEKFGVKLAARQSFTQTKKLETLGNRPLLMQNEIYYLSALFGL